MGYLSEYEILVDDGAVSDDRLSYFASRLKDISGGYEFVVWEDCVQSEECIKWYDHAEDITTLSSEFPDHVFNVRANGEDGERWQVYARNGKSYSERVIPHWPGVDESLLI